MPGPIYPVNPRAAQQAVQSLARRGMGRGIPQSQQPIEGPNIWPQRPEQFRSQLPVAPTPPTDLSLTQADPSKGLLEGAGREGLEGGINWSYSNELIGL